MVYGVVQLLAGSVTILRNIPQLVQYLSLERVEPSTFRVWSLFNFAADGTQSFRPPWFHYITMV